MMEKAIAVYLGILFVVVIISFVNGWWESACWSQLEITLISFWMSRQWGD